ncbi:SRPBCC domain-containing protein [Virgisporangium ochraceum]|uniref:Activator of HSP90 ATPase n=1 Tax=Virgisporangium ochraceum TaxID=65505 RepID=A0A8J4A5I1_9ACTN|nr:SRPBCC domain-containing protein [Virgisporangium ochraceum]GIJ73745.1 activator of HSP90 ATPase [Virgisporangium ochraceum]
MVDILHRVGVKDATPENVYEALTTVDGLAGWWTTDTSEHDGVLRFRFPPIGGFDMEVLETRPAERVTWKVVDGPEEWIGTTVDWQLRREGEYTVILFGHRGWKEPVEFMNHCSTKWATFLLSLKSLVENGKGSPAPDDVRVGDWH